MRFKGFGGGGGGGFREFWVWGLGFRGCGVFGVVGFGALGFSGFGFLVCSNSGFHSSQKPNPYDPEPASPKNSAAFWLPQGGAARAVRLLELTQLGIPRTAGNSRSLRGLGALRSRGVKAEAFLCV